MTDKLPNSPIVGSKINTTTNYFVTSYLQISLTHPPYQLPNPDHNTDGTHLLLPETQA